MPPLVSLTELVALERIAAVTGAGGFVGSRIVEGMVQLGWQVRAFTSRPVSRPPGASVTLVPCDWSVEQFADAIASIRDAILWIHAAALVDFSAEAALELYRANALLTDKLASHVACLVQECRLVYLSTISVYGQSQVLSPEAEPEPDTHYGLSKLLGERLCFARLGSRCLTLRLPGVWGREDPPKLFVNKCLRKAAAGEALRISGKGQARRNYLWVGDLVPVISSAYLEKRNGVLLLGSPECSSLREMVEAIAEKTGVAVEADPRNGPVVERDMILPTSPGLTMTPFREALAVELARS